jgi:hypothetical protein
MDVPVAEGTGGLKWCYGCKAYLALERFPSEAQNPNKRLCKRCKLRRLVLAKPESLRPCAGCGEHKPASEFYKLSNAASGRQTVCKLCFTARYRRADQKVQICAAQKRRRATDFDYFARTMESRQRSEARKRGARFVEEIDAASVYERDQGTCQLCHRPVDKTARGPKQFSLNHILPLSAGGAHTEMNVETTHLRCNQLAGASDAFRQRGLQPEDVELPAPSADFPAESATSTSPSPRLQPGSAHADVSTPIGDT